ncbi:hypothetical protein NBRC111894_396 [Sporolactobacillus inulinus]|uniref:Uncharacterized protein n=1 Tax=Sporolactobacillus inulinus TaxID=2078 RepID=A0A4Y1Z719_9BACL|nr:hypothetical protein NBRC111894_396 [Sporolactobacillus inulinus]
MKTCQKRLKVLLLLQESRLLRLHPEESGSFLRKKYGER